jgi:putative redox protein
MPNVRFAFRANPRSHLFPQAQGAAEAAEIAAAHGKFWEMHDALFQAKDGDLSRPRLTALAREIGLDAGSFDRDLDAGVYKAAVHAQEISGWHSHVLSTPTFFINGLRFDDSLDRLPNAVTRAQRQAESLREVFREARVRSTEHPRRQLISIGPHELVADLPADEDGQDTGPSPHDLLLAALGACTSMTIQWWAQHHRLKLEHVDVRLSQSRTEQGHLFRCSIEVTGDLTEAELAQLKHAAEVCPVARTLTHGVAVEARVVADRRVEEAGEESFPASDPPPWTSGR